MAKQSKSTLKSYFRTGLRPTQVNFEELIDSMVSGEDEIFIGPDPDKKVGIGTKTPKQKLEVEGAIQVGNLPNDADGTPGTIRFKNNKFEGFDGTNWVDLGASGGGASFWSKLGTDPLAYNDEVVINIDPNDPSGKTNLGMGVNSNGTKIALFERAAQGANPAVVMGLGSLDENKLVFHVNGKSGSFDFYDDKPENAGSSRIMSLRADLARLSLSKNANPAQLSLEVRSESRRRIPAVGCMTESGNSWAYLSVDGTGRNSGVYWEKGRAFIMAGETIIPANNNVNPASTTTFITFDTDGKTKIGNLEAVGTLIPGSDIRLKTQLSPFDQGLELIKKLNPIRFQYKKDVEHQREDWHLGLVAQELQSVCPEMVVPLPSNNGTESTEDPMLGIKASELVYLAFNAVKELDKRVQELEAKLAQLGIRDSTIGEA